MKRVAVVFAFGVALGFVLDRLGFADWGEVRRMFTLADLRLLFTFAGAVALTGAALAIAGRGRILPARPIHRGTIAGALLFGIGWAIAGACPGAAFVQLGEGRLLALVTVGGVLFGTFAYERVHARWLRFERSGCGD